MSEPWTCSRLSATGHSTDTNSPMDCILLQSAGKDMMKKPAVWHMRQVLIKCINCALLIVVLIGIPAITGARFGSLRISSAPRTQMLILWGLSLAAAVNGVAALGLAGDAGNRRLCRGWAFAFAGLLAIEYGFFHGYVNFDWLKQSLVWLKQHV